MIFCQLVAEGEAVARGAAKWPPEHSTPLPPGCSSRHIKQDLDSRTLRGVLVLGGDEVPFALLLSLFAATILGAALYAVHPPRDHEITQCRIAA